MRDRCWPIGVLVVETAALAVAVALAGAVAAPARAADLGTDTSRALVPLEEIRPGGPPPDGIPPVDHPAFVAPAAADAWLGAAEPVLALEIAGDARAYPFQILLWHEIVNDTVGGVPVAATFCPLCNSGLVFERALDGRVYDFGTSGRLYKSDLVMYDRQTHSLWAQLEGRAIVGALAGKRLRLVPANTVTYGEWKAAHPSGKVLSRQTGHQRAYGENPYAGYDEPGRPPFLFDGKVDPRLPPMERVAGIVLGQTARAYPFLLLARRRVIADHVGGQDLVVLFRPEALSVLDRARIAESRAVGAAAVYDPAPDGRRLTFEPTPEGFRDRETGSAWNLLGEAVRGPLAGTRLRPIAHVDAFWFAWAAFHPATSIARD